MDLAYKGSTSDKRKRVHGSPKPVLYNQWTNFGEKKYCLNRAVHSDHVSREPVRRLVHGAPSAREAEDRYELNGSFKREKGGKPRRRKKKSSPSGAMEAAPTVVRVRTHREDDLKSMGRDKIKQLGRNSSIGPKRRSSAAETLQSAGFKLKIKLK